MYRVTRKTYGFSYSKAHGRGDGNVFVQLWKYSFVPNWRHSTGREYDQLVVFGGYNCTHSEMVPIGKVSENNCSRFVYHGPHCRAGLVSDLKSRFPGVGDAGFFCAGYGVGRGWNLGVEFDFNISFAAKCSKKILPLFIFCGDFLLFLEGRFTRHRVEIGVEFGFLPNKKGATLLT